MRHKSFLILAGVTGISVLAATGSLLTGGTTPAFAAAGDKLFPQLEAASADIKKIEILDGDFSMNIELREGKFVDANSGYPVNPEPLKELVANIALAEIAEAKTTNPERFADLQLADSTAEEGSGTEIIISDTDNKTLAHVIAGNRDFTLGGITGGQFVRRGNEEATWLVSARLDPPTRRASWFDNKLLDIDGSDIKSVTLTTYEGQTIPMQNTDGELTIAAPVLNNRVEASNQLGRLSRLVEGLTFTDVRAETDVSNEVENAASLFTALHDGTTITVSEVSDLADEETTWIRFDITGDTDLASELSSKTDGFEFALSNTNADIFDWTLEDLTEVPAS